MTSTPTAELLLAHQDWVRALARNLVDDPARADDVTQQTLLEAMTRPPRDWRSPRGWLATVARNAARAFARQESRRHRREEAVARADVVTVDPAAAIDRATAHKRLVDEVFALEEPYHTVLLLRFFEDLEAREIAEQLGRPVATVRTQLQRGLERMRTRLDDEFGGREAWGALILPLFSARQGVTAAAASGTAATFAVWHWLAPLLVVGIALFVGLGLLQGAGDPQPLNTASTAGGAGPAGAGGSQPATPNERRSADVTSPIPIPDANPVAGEPSLVGRLLTLDGRPAVGVEVVWHDPAMPRLDGRRLVHGNTSMDLDQPSLQAQFVHEAGVELFARRYAPYQKEVAAMIRGEPVGRPRATADGRGGFELAGPEGLAGVRIEHADWGIYGNGRNAAGELVLVVGSVAHVRGRIVDGAGNPIAGVYLGASYSFDSIPGLPQTLRESSGFRSFNDTTDRLGAFDLGSIPRIAGLTVRAQKRGYESLGVKLADIVDEQVWTLPRTPERQRWVVSGIVQHQDGRPAGGAVLRHAGSGTQANELGRFEFDLHSPSRLPLTAHLRGYQPAVLGDFGKRMRSDRSAGRDLVLTLGPEALELHGRVLDPSGEPLAGARVLIQDGTPYGTFPGWLENWIGRQDRDGELTAGDGSFVLRGLADRSYTLRVVEPRTLLVIESQPVAAGSQNVELRAPADAYLGTIAGVIVDRAGNGIPGLKVQLDTVKQRFGTGSTSYMGREPRLVTDADGRFEIHDCPRRHVRLWVNGDGIEGRSVPLPEHGGPLRIEVSRLLRFRLRVATAGAQSFVVVDAAGERLVVVRNSLGMTGHFRENAVPAADASPVYDVVDSAVELLLLADDEVVRRVPLALQVGELNEVDI
ncbi:MAG: sigma-70 family RNA polymerase sigma factor [bacterium]|nr:sigma-70 family RNA polymerase sigma factor [bacterium]